MRFLPAIFANLALLISAFGFGRLLRRFFPDNFSVIDRVALRILGGLGLLGIVLFCVGQIWFSRTAILLVLLLGVLLSTGIFGGVVRAARAAFAMLAAPLLPLVVISSVLSL